MFEKAMEFLGYIKAEKDAKTGDIRIGDHIYRETEASKVAHMTGNEVRNNAIEAIKKYGLIRT